MKNCIYQQRFLNGCKSYSLDLPLAISYENLRKSLAYFSHLAPLIRFFFLKGKVKRVGAWHNAPSPKYASD